jgi:hypothetical protein
MTTTGPIPAPTTGPTTGPTTDPRQPAAAAATALPPATGGPGGREHPVEHAAPAPDARRRAALAWALGLNAVLLVGEVVAGLAFGSLALLADATHLVSDVAGLLIALGGAVLAARPVTARHSFGLARAEILAAQASAVLLLAAGGWIGVESVHRLGDPVSVNGGGSRRWPGAGWRSTWSARSWCTATPVMT